MASSLRRGSGSKSNQSSGLPITPPTYAENDEVMIAASYLDLLDTQDASPSNERLTGITRTRMLSIVIRLKLPLTALGIKGIHGTHENEGVKTRDIEKRKIWIEKPRKWLRLGHNTPI